MRKILITSFVSLCLVVVAFANGEESTLTANFTSGNPGIASISTITFGPQGILFLGDTQGASVIAVDTKDTKPIDEGTKVEMKEIDKQIAAIMGTTADQIMIIDMAVNPISKSIYLAVQKKEGTPALMKLSRGKLSAISLDEASYSKVDLSNPIAEDAKDRRGRSLRKWAISDIGYHDGKVLLTGLSNEEFSSTFRSIPFPFEKKAQMASLEIYHAAHGRFETYAPVKTFMPFELKGAPHVIASYTCTPLVVFPMQDLKAGQHIKGKTVAELGNRNSPLDMVSYTKNGKTYILLANSNRAMMKIDAAEVADFGESITSPVEGNSETAGVNFLALPYVNVLQLDKLNEETIVIIQRTSAGALNLSSVGKNRL